MFAARMNEAPVQSIMRAPMTFDRALIVLKQAIIQNVQLAREYRAANVTREIHK
jgi:hypothetical protein